MIFTNKEFIHPALLVWLARDEYDHNKNPMHFSATELIKPTRRVVLEARSLDFVPDISSIRRTITWRAE